MFKFKISILLFLFIGSVSIAQNKYAKSIKLKALQYAKATKENNFKQVVDLTYPKLVKLLNKDSLLNKVSKEMVDLREKGLRYKSITYNEPNSLYTSNNVLYCIIPQKIIKMNSQGKITIDTFLFSISNDNGLSWYFMTEDQFLTYKDQLFSKLNPAMEIPKNNSVYKRNKKFTAFDKPN